MMNTTTQECNECRKGTYRGSTDKDDACRNCSAGYYNDDTGQGSCLPCIPGEFNDVAGAISCKECRVNSFSTLKNRQVPCDACAEGRTSDKGSTKCSDCAPGKFKNNVNDKVVCTECPIGFAQEETHQTNCTQCKKGEEATAKGSSFCTSCDLGKFNLISGKDCLNCPIGQFQDDKGKTKCKDCRKDTYGVELKKTNGDIRPALSNADCSKCPVKTTTGSLVGQTAKSTCVCQDSYYYDASVETDAHEDRCIECPEFEANCTVANITLETMQSVPGYWRETKQDAVFFKCREGDCIGGLVHEQCRKGNRGALCAVCEIGFVRIDGECTQCAVDLVADGYTGIIFAATVPPILFFIFVLVFFCRRVNSSKEKPIEKKTSVKKKSSSSSKIVPSNQIVPKETKTSVAVTNNITTSAATTSAATTSAATTTTNNRLSENTRNHFEQAKIAVQALTILNNSVAGTGVSELVGETIEEHIIEEITGDMTSEEIEADTAENTFENKFHIDQSATTNHFKKRMAGRLRILIGYLQITSALVFSFDIPWPPMTLRLLKSLTFINFNFIDVFAPLDPCVLHTSFLKQAAFHMAILPLCTVVIVLAALLGLIRNKAAVIRSKAKSTLVNLVFLLYPGIVTRIFTTFKCQRIGEKRYLVADYNVICDEGNHIFMSVIMLVMIGVYVIGIPLFSVLILHRNKQLLAVEDDAPESLQLKASNFAEVYGAIFEGYQKEYWYFESIILLQKALLTGGLVLIAPGSSAQILVGLVIAAAFLIILMQTKPYEDSGENGLQTIATISTVATLLIGFTLKVDRSKSNDGGEGEYDNAIIDIILVSLFACVSLSGAYMLVTSLPCFVGGDEEKIDDGEENGETECVINSRSKQQSQYTEEVKL